MRKNSNSGKSQKTKPTKCRNCGKPLPHSAVVRGKPFCGNHCRKTWWNNQRGEPNPYAPDYSNDYNTCFYCGRQFAAHSRRQRYCSVECQRRDCGKGKA